MIVKSDNPFCPELRTMAFVPRWSILWTTAVDTIASHSYFVAIYAYMIAYTINWKGPRDYLLFLALFHDIDETITGDIVGPSKRHIIDKENAEAFIQARMDERYGGMLNALYDLEDTLSPGLMNEAERIVSAADNLDALLFLMVEHRRGNQTIKDTLQGQKAAVEAAWRGLPATKETLDLTWQTVVLPAIADHWDQGGKGVGRGNKDG